MLDVKRTISAACLIAGTGIHGDDGVEYRLAIEKRQKQS